jgi:catechol 2,3-dioxygenase-like lactoylglutathione lyase family enzyme
MFTGWHHTCVNVSNLERSVAFYSEILGLKVTLRADIDNAEIAKVVGIPGVKIAAAFLEVPGTETVVEMFQYVSCDPKPLPEDRKSCDIGIHHICFQVDDIEASYQELKAKGVHFHTEPMTISPDEPNFAGAKICYFSDPDGAMLELLEAPG